MTDIKPHQDAPTAWTVLKRDRVFDASPFVAVDREAVQLPDGRVIDDYYQVDLPDFAVAVPVLADGQVLTQWQYKHGAGVVSLTFPAGQLEPGEAAEAAMVRELREETGYSPEQVTALGDYQINGNQGCARAHLFLMTGCTLTDTPDHDDLEEWDLRRMHPAEIDAAIQDGQLAILPHLAVWLAAKAHLSP